MSASTHIRRVGPNGLIAIGFFFVSLLVSLPALEALQGAQTPAPELIFVNAKIYTVDPMFSVAEAAAIANGRFAAVGSTAQVRRLAGPSTRIIDLGGKTVIPGLSDNHLHGAGGGPGVDLSRARTLDEVLHLISARVKQATRGEIVI